MLQFGQDPREMRDPLHRHPLLAAVLQGDDPYGESDNSYEEDLLRRYKYTKQLAA